MTDSSPYQSLFDHIGAVQDAEREDIPHEFRLHRLLNEVEAQQRKEFVRSPLANWFNWGSAVAVSVALSLTVFYFFLTPPTPATAPSSVVATLEATDGLDLTSESTRRVVVFEDKTTVAVLPNASISVERAGASGARVHLKNGTLEFDGHHDASNDWTLVAGPHTVTVLGTSFALTFNASSKVLGLKVTDGLVRVDGPGISREFKKGDVWNSEDPVEVASKLEPKEETVARRKESTRRAPKKRAPSVSWLDLHKQRKHAQAVKAAKSQGLSKLLKKLSAADLERLADSARFSHDKSLARRVLTSLRKRHANAPQASVAAYKLGLLGSGAKSQARWFSRYLKEAPSGALRREALGRLLDAELRAKAPGVQTTARRYLKAYPKGPHASSARRALGM